MEISDKNISDDKNMNERTSRLKMDAPKILQKFGKFQKLSLAMLCPASGCMGMSTLIFVFLNIIPDYECIDQQENVNVSTI